MENKLREHVEAGNRRFMQALAERDARGLAECYTENARILPPGGEMTAGRENIRQFWQGVMDSGVSEARLETVEVTDCGEGRVQEIGRFRLTIRQGDETVYSPGKYVVLWHRERDDWKLDVDIWNN